MPGAKINPKWSYREPMALSRQAKLADFIVWLKQHAGKENTDGTMRHDA